VAKRSWLNELKGKLSSESLGKGFKHIRWQMDPFSWIQLGSTTIYFGIFLILPLLAVTYNSLYFEGFFSLRWFYFIFSDQFYLPGIDGIRGVLFERVGDVLYIKGMDFGVIPNSLIVAALTTLFTAIIGSILAFVFARYTFRGSEILRILLLIPLLSTPFVGAIGLKRMISQFGVLNTIFFEILHILPFRIVFDGLAAVVLVQTLLFYPIAFLNTYTSLINVDTSLEEQAENMGSSGFRLFRTITLPLATPGIEAGALLVFILSIEDLGTPIVFKGTSAEKTMTYQIFSKMFTETGYIMEEVTALALLLLLISAVIFMVIRKYVSLRRYAMLTKGGMRRPRMRNLSWKTTILVYIVFLGLLFFAALPHIGVGLLAFTDRWTGGLFPDSYTLENFARVFQDPFVFGSIVNSLLYSSIATIIIVILGVSAAHLISRKRVFGIGLLDTLVTIPIALPGIVVATGLLILFLNTPLSPAISAAPLLIISYSIRKFPFTLRSVFSGLEQTDKALEEAAVNVGATRLRTFLTVTLPLVLINIFAGAMLSFVYCVSEVSTALVIGSADPGTAPMTWRIYDLLSSGIGRGGILPAAAMGLMLMALQFVMIVGSNYLLRKRAESTALISI
jgi:ABC-type Fe3+ transport system permease subunit